MAKAAKLEEKTDLKPWPSDPKAYQWKGTISEQNGQWHVLCHCKPRETDVFLKVRSSKHDSGTEIDQFTEITTKLINIRHPNLMTPVHAFSHKSEIYSVYPRHSGGPISEVLSSHYPNGIQNEDIVASILYHSALGLQNLHNNQQCHRNIRAGSLHIDIDEGITLLTNFGTMKEIKWKHAAGRRNTAVSPEREPFTDPLILLGMDEKATWYTSDIYALGITALQLTYGTTPTLNTKKILNGQFTISTDLYDKKCPFGKSFESLIKECCGPLESRLSVKKLVEHKFFKRQNCPDPAGVQNFFGHILKSTEQRINSSLPIPPSMKTFDDSIIPSDISPSNENVDDSNLNVVVSPDKGIHHGQDSKEEDVPSMDDTFSFSTTINSTELKKIMQAKGDEKLEPTSPMVDHPPTIHEDQVALHQANGPGPTMHNAPALTSGSSTASYNDPSSSHHLTPRSSPLGAPSDQDFQPTDELMKSSRNYRFSFSQSMDHSADQTENTTNPVLTPSDSIPIETPQQGQETPVPTQKIGRFKVAAGRLSESLPSGDTENSETYDPDEVEEDGADSDSVPIQQLPTVVETKPKGRFIVSPAAPEQELSADDRDEDLEDAKSPDIDSAEMQDIRQPVVDEPATLQPKQQQQPPLVNGMKTPKWTAPQKDKSQWTCEECSEWVQSLGKAYSPYGQVFIDNGVDGSLLSDENPEELQEMLQEIMSNKLHLKKIIKEWNKVQAGVESQ